MIMKKRIVTASLFVVALLNYSQALASPGFTAAKFVQLERAAQDSYFQTSVMMAGVVATQTHTNLAGCIDQWYFESSETMQERNDFMRETMAQYPDHHPSGVIAAFIQKACGSFKDRD